MPSPPIDDFKHEQKQSRQWLLLQGRSNNGMDISTKAHCQLLRYFSAISPRGRDVVGRDVLGDESRAMLARLDAERAKHRALQGGVMRVTDSFVMKHVQEDLEERMRRLSLEHVSRKARYMSSRERQKFEWGLRRQKRERLRKKEAEEAAGGRRMLEASQLMDGLVFDNKD